MNQRFTVVIAVAALLVMLSGTWQIGAAVVENVELQDDMKDLASQLGARIGFSNPLTDDDLRNTVVRKAEKYRIELRPDEVTVLRTGSGENTEIYLAADYKAHIHIPGVRFALHFTPSSGRRP